MPTNHQQYKVTRGYLVSSGNEDTPIVGCKTEAEAAQIAAELNVEQNKLDAAWRSRDQVEAIRIVATATFQLKLMGTAIRNIRMTQMCLAGQTTRQVSEKYGVVPQTVHRVTKVTFRKAQFKVDLEVDSAMDYQLNRARKHRSYWEPRLVALEKLVIEKRREHERYAGQATVAAAPADEELCAHADGMESDGLCSECGYDIENCKHDWQPDGICRLCNFSREDM